MFLCRNKKHISTFQMKKVPYKLSLLSVAQLCVLSLKHFQVDLVHVCQWEDHRQWLVVQFHSRCQEAQCHNRI